MVLVLLQLPPPHATASCFLSVCVLSALCFFHRTRFNQIKLSYRQWFETPQGDFSETILNLNAQSVMCRLDVGWFACYKIPVFETLASLGALMHIASFNRDAVAGFGISRMGTTTSTVGKVHRLHSKPTVHVAHVCVCMCVFGGVWVGACVNIYVYIYGYIYGFHSVNRWLNG